MKRYLLALVLWMISISSFAQEKLPIIFVHGIWINSEAYEYVIPIKKIFKKFGYKLFVARTPPGGSVEQKSEILFKEITRLVPTGKFHLIGHSMGGLDARLAIHKYNLGERCVSLTTLATPHRGSHVADFVIRHFGESLAMDVLEKVFRGDVLAVNQLTTTHMQETFNKSVVNDQRVKYFSMGFYIPRPVHRNSIIPWLWVAHSIQVKAGALESDGMVSVDSANWGESLGVFPGDHYSETGPIPLSGKLMYEDIYKKVSANLDSHF